MIRRRLWLCRGGAALLAGSAALHRTHAAAEEWPVSTAQSQGFEPGRLAAVLDRAAGLAALRALVVVRRGHLVAERYGGGAAASHLQPIHSVTKSVCSMLVGMALEQGRIKSLDDTVGRLLPEAAARFADAPAKEVTLRQILSGHSGLAYDHRFQAHALATAADPMAYAMQRPRAPQGAAVWNYNDPAVSLLAPILARAWGQPLQRIAQNELFTPLALEQHEWQHDRLGSAMSWTGLRLRPRDLAKLAWLMADGGRWRGRQVLPAPWVAISTQTHSRADWEVAPVADIGYGHLWFTGRLQGHAVVWGWGYGAQFAMFVPALELVVCSNALAPAPQQLPEHNRTVMAVVAEVVAAADKL